MIASFNYDVKECMRELYPESRWGLLTILMLFANAQRRCWPSIDGLAHLMHTSQRKVTKARDWLIEHKALESVPYDKRVGDELKQPARQLIYQLTGNVVIDGKSYAYLYADVSGGGNIKSRGKGNVSDGDVSDGDVSDGGNGTKIPSEVKPKEESQSVSLRSTDCARAPEPTQPPSVSTFGNALSEPEEKVPPKRKGSNTPPNPVVWQGGGRYVGPFKTLAAARRYASGQGTITDLSAVPTGTMVEAAPIEPKKPPKPWSALTTAMHEAIPSAIRPPRCHYGKNDRAARALHEAGFTAQEVREFVLWSYDYDPWLMSGGTGGAAIPATMYYVETHIKPWKAKHNGPSSHNPDRFAPPPGVRFARPAP